MIKNLATTTTALITKINEVKNKISNITNLATTTTTPTAVRNKIPDHRRYITIPKFNKLNNLII